MARELRLSIVIKLPSDPFSEAAALTAIGPVKDAAIAELSAAAPEGSMSVEMELVTPKLRTAKEVKAPSTPAPSGDNIASGTENRINPDDQTTV